MSDTLLDQMFPVDGELRTPRSRQPATSFATHIQDAGRPRASDEICTRWQSMCSLELRGFDKREIAAKLGVAYETVIVATNTERYKKHRAERLAELDDDFHAMKPLALAALKGGLGSNDENTALRASEQWFKAASFGGYSKTEAPSTSLTAEDVARQLLGVQVNVTVNNVSEPQREALNSRPSATIADESGE